jgi:hypothetical protein
MIFEVTRACCAIMPARACLGGVFIAAGGDRHVEREDQPPEQVQAHGVASGRRGQVRGDEIDEEEVREPEAAAI